MALFEIEKTNNEIEQNWYELHNCTRLMDWNKWLNDTSSFRKVSHSSDDEIVKTAIKEGILSTKNYMDLFNLENSIIVKSLLKSCNYICNELNIDINNAICGISYLFMEYKGGNSYIKLPDKKLASILKVNKQNCHLFAELLNYILKDYFEIKLDFKSGYYIYKINKTDLELDDPFIIDTCEYLYYKYLKPVNKKSKKFQEKWKRIWKKYRYVEFKKLDKRKERYYENSLYSEVISRECFKILFIGLAWYYTKLTEKYTIPESLTEIREINGEREDIFYLENPIFILQEVTGLSGKELTKRINAIVNGMGTLMYRHDLSYINIKEPDGIFSAVKKDEYQELGLVKHKKLNTYNGKVIQDEAYMASIQGFQTTSFSYILNSDYFKTKLGKIILENKDTFLAIIKNYFLKHPEGDSNYDYYNKILKEKDIKADILPIILAPEQIKELLNNELKDIDVTNIDIKNNIKKLVNKDKLWGLPAVIAKRKRKFSYKDCMEKDKHNKLKLDKERKIILKSPESCTYILYRMLNQLSGDDIKSNCSINVSYGNGKKVFDESTLSNLNDFLSVSKEINHKKEYYNLGYDVKQFELCRDVIINRFKLGFKSCIEELKRLVMCIRKFHLGSCFTDCEVMEPYMKYFFV